MTLHATNQIDLVRVDDGDIPTERLEEIETAVESTQADVSSTNDSIIEIVNTFNSAFEELNGALEATTEDAAATKEALNNVLGYITIEPSIPRIRVAINQENYVDIGADKVAFYADGKENAYMANDRLYSPSSVITNLYMQTKEPATGEFVGNLAWIARSNGHLSLKKAK